MPATVHEWFEPPPMDPGAPLPSVRMVGNRLWVAYLRRAPDEATGALLRFDGVADYHFGTPNDERLHTHPLYAAGLGFYGFYEAHGSSRLVGREGKRHWIVTFHDETLEVVADEVFVSSEKIEGEDTRAMLTDRG